jgi:hypothetical protein
MQHQQAVHQLVEDLADEPPVRMVGGLGQERMGLGLLLKLIRFGFILAPTRTSNDGCSANSECSQRPTCARRPVTKAGHLL